MKEIMVKVTWIDASHYGEVPADNLDKLEIVKNATVGFLVKETDEMIVVAMEKTLNDDIRNFRDVVVIPKIYIEQIEILSPAAATSPGR